MILSLAPMEGLTGHIFRAVHAECFGALDRYYTPFLAPPHLGSGFGKRAMAELDPAENRGLDVVPQLLTNDAERFVWGAQVLADMGFREVNLNLGCPSGTVVAKGRGSGFLRDLEALDAFLEKVCAESPIPVSVKTRIGVAADEEYEQILAVYLRHPLAELIVHPRVQRDRYQGIPRQAAYGETLRRAPFPVAYNGDIFDCGDMDALLATYPATRHVMLGRGILANPALARTLRGGAPATREELERFHDKLFEAYFAEMGGNVVFRMKEWWSYARCSFANPLSVHRRVRKVRKVEEYQAAVHDIFRKEELAAAPRFTWSC
ncbi:tRNA-dihydrouridine synthase family protein [Enorma sp.]|uniref:tRNA dihydrouridine synthase n=1 Tax=Enorma sp. TaxID=1920692 RepID=UPI0025C59852|nr:tRNA-dihydrouridine synthase family protein [Enorma sp.]